MKNRLYFILALISLLYLTGMYILGKRSGRDVLGMGEETFIPSPSPIEAITPTPKTTPSSAPSPSPKVSSPEPKMTESPNPLPASTPASSSEVNAFIDRFAAQYGVDTNVLRYIAICESGFRSNAENAGYAGLYQFGSTTWKNLRAEIGEDTNPDLRYSAEESVQTASYALSKGKNGIWPNCIP